MGGLMLKDFLYHKKTAADHGRCCCDLWHLQYLFRRCLHGQYCHCIVWYAGSGEPF